MGISQVVIAGHVVVVICLISRQLHRKFSVLLAYELICICAQLALPHDRASAAYRDVWHRTLVPVFIGQVALLIDAYRRFQRGGDRWTDLGLLSAGILTSAAVVSCVPAASILGPWTKMHSAATAALAVFAGALLVANHWIPPDDRNSLVHQRIVAAHLASVGLASMLVYWGYRGLLAGPAFLMCDFAWAACLRRRRPVQQVAEPSPDSDILAMIERLRKTRIRSGS